MLLKPLQSEEGVWSPLLLHRKNQKKGRPLIGAGFHRYRSAVQDNDFTNKRKPQADAAHFPASGFIHPKERLENAVPIFLRYAEARIGNAQAHLFAS